MANQSLPAHLLENPFYFDEADVRIAINENGEPLFCALDVCAVLDITWSGKTLRDYPESWKFKVYGNMNQGGDGLLMVSEPGLFRLIFRSSKPKAVEFTNWVCEEVLPSIRKSGFFGTIPTRDRMAYSKQILAIAEKLADTKDAMLHKLLTSELRNLCNLIGQKMPDLTLLGRDYRQLGLGIEESA